MAAHSSILAWRIPWTEEPGGLQSMGSQRVHGVSKSPWGHKESDTTERLSMCACRSITRGLRRLGNEETAGMAQQQAPWAVRWDALAETQGGGWASRAPSCSPAGWSHFSV